MMITEIECKTALSTSSLPGLTYSLNPYRGCQHNCAYCYAPSVLRIERKNWNESIQVKKNIPRIISKELPKKKPGVVGLSTVTDPYQPVEKKYQLSRRCLELLLENNFPVCVQTKSALIIRDIDLLKKFSRAEVMLSIGTLHDDQRKILEPGGSPIKERLQTLRAFSDAGIKTTIFYGPIYPTTQLEEIPGILDVFCDQGVHEMLIDRLNLRPGVRETLQERLFPHKEWLTVFSKFCNDSLDFYQLIHDMIIAEGKKRNMKITDAF
jgi:DNA repair photolyase